MISLLWAGLYGRFISAPQAEGDDADAYSLFVRRSSALGWLSESRTSVNRGLWGMNDAQLQANDGGAGDLAGWFQVDVTDDEASLPVAPIQPLLSCVGAVVNRLGHLDLDAVQMLLSPLAGRAPDSDRALAYLATTALWHPLVDHRAVQITIDTGQDPTVVTHAEMLVGHLSTLQQEVFHLDSWSSSSVTEASGIPGIHDDLWGGPFRHRVTLRGTLAGWGLDPIGWLLTYVTHACAMAGVHRSAVLHVRPSPT